MSENYSSPNPQPPLQSVSKRSVRRDQRPLTYGLQHVDRGRDLHFMSTRREYG